MRSDIRVPVGQGLYNAESPRIRRARIMSFGMMVTSASATLSTFCQFVDIVTVKRDFETLSRDQRYILDCNFQNNTTSCCQIHAYSKAEQGLSSGTRFAWRAHKLLSSNVDTMNLATSTTLTNPNQWHDSADNACVIAVSSKTASDAASRRLGSLLESHEGLRLEPQATSSGIDVCPLSGDGSWLRTSIRRPDGCRAAEAPVLSAATLRRDLAHEALEGPLAKEQIRRPLTLIRRAYFGSEAPLIVRSEHWSNDSLCLRSAASCHRQRVHCLRTEMPSTIMPR